MALKRATTSKNKVVTKPDIISANIGKTGAVFLNKLIVSAINPKINPKTGIRLNAKDNKPIIQAKTEIFLVCSA